MGRLKSREWTSKHQVARVDIVGVDNAGVDIAGVDIAGVIGSRKSMCAQKVSYTLSRPMCCSYFWQMRHKTKAHVAYNHETERCFWTCQLKECE